MKTKQTNLWVLIVFLLCFLYIFSACESECTSRVDNMKIYAVVSDTTTEATSWVPGWYRSEFQNGNLHFTLEFDHFVGGQGKCNWVWENYPLKNAIELYADITLYTATDTLYQFESLIEYFEIETYETDSNYITFLLSQKPEYNFQFTEVYYTFTAKISTDDGLDMEDSCIVKIID